MEINAGTRISTVRSHFWKATFQTWREMERVLLSASAMQVCKLIFLSFIFAYFAISLALAADEIVLGVGEQRSLPVLAGTKFSVGNPQVIQVKNVRMDDGRSMLVVRGKRLGYSDLVLLEGSASRSLMFQVAARRTGAGIRDVRSALGAAAGIEVLPSGDQWVVRGEAQSAEEHNLVEAFARPQGQGVIKLARLSPMARALAEERIAIQLASAGLTQLKVRGAGSRIWLEGTALNPAEAELALGLAREIFQAAESRIRVPFESDDVIRFKVRVLELAKTANDNTGMLWNTAIPGIIALHQKLLRGNLSLEATLNMLAKRGFARILSEPSITVNAKGVAELRVGGEIPIPIRTKQTQNVLWKAYGLSLRIEVPGSAGALVRTKLAVEVSSIDMANAVDGIPGIKLNKMETIVDLRTDRTIFLSGLLQEEAGESESALPWLGRIPVLGALFRSREYLERKTELVIAITANQAAGRLADAGAGR